MTKDKHKTYLGDSVYVQIENGMILLTLNNGMGDENPIFLEDQVYDNLVEWVEERRKEVLEEIQNSKSEK